MKYTESLKIAKAFLTQIEIIAQINNINTDNFVVSTYTNGREQGYSIFAAPQLNPEEPITKKYRPRRVTFTKSRHANQITIYSAPDEDFDANNIPSDTIYRLQQLYEYTEIAKAAAQIIKYLSFQNK